MMKFELVETPRNFEQGHHYVAQFPVGKSEIEVTHWREDGPVNCALIIGGGAFRLQINSITPAQLRYLAQGLNAVADEVEASSSQYMPEPEAA
jgi:hypothetical protein